MLAICSLTNVDMIIINIIILLLLIRYVAADMQMLCIVILPLLVMISKPRQGLFLVSMLGIASSIYAGVVMVVYDTSPTVLVLPLYLAQVTTTRQFPPTIYIYTKTYTNVVTNVNVIVFSVLPVNLVQYLPAYVSSCSPFGYVRWHCWRIHY